MIFHNYVHYYNTTEIQLFESFPKASNQQYEFMQ